MPPPIESSATQPETALWPAPHNWRSIFINGSLGLSRGEISVFTQIDVSSFRMDAIESRALQIILFSHSDKSARWFSRCFGAHLGRVVGAVGLTVRLGSLPRLALRGPGVQKATAPD